MVLKFGLSGIVLESVPEVENVGRPIFMKLAPEVGLIQIFQMPSWFCSLTFCSKVTGGSHLSLHFIKKPVFERESLDHHENKQIKPFQ